MRFRRRNDEVSDDLGAEPAADAADETASDAAPEGPFDVDDLSAEEREARLDLGSLLISPAEGTEVRVQVDEASGQVQAVLIAGPDGALELRAFAAPRNGDLWGEVRPQIAADMAQRGGTASEHEGSFGTELVCELRTTMADGRTGLQQSRIVGVNGSRWMLRASFIGGPARPGAHAAAWEATLRRVAVRRGAHALPVGEALPVTLPEQARRLPPEEVGENLADLPDTEG